MATLFGKITLQSSFLKKNVFLYKVLKYSTAACAAVATPQDQLPRFRTSENNPTRHTFDHVGKFYRIDDSVKQKLFPPGTIPGLFELQMKTFRENCIMVRETPLVVISYLNQINFSQPAVRFILYGRFGTGKTTSLMHLVHYGYESKYLLVHAPWVSIWTKRPKEVLPSQFKENMFDLPVESAAWLQHFLLQNEELMKELDLRTTQKYTWSQREVTEEGEPLLAVVDHGIKRVRHSSDCVAVLLKEIKLQSRSNKFKAMVIVDGVNAFFNKTNVKRTLDVEIPSEEMTICKAFMKMLKNDWNNAVIITSVDILPYKRNYTMQDPYTPRILLGKEGFELMDPFIHIETKNYSDKEFESTMDYYIDRLWIQSERARGETGRKQLKFLTGYNPFYLMKLCDPL